jgi:hypothetical protein
MKVNLMKKNLIITATDKEYGDFTIEHWYKFLCENVNLDDIDVTIIDYGMSVAQKYYFEKNGVNLYSAERNGHVAVIRFRDAYKYLQTDNHNQIMFCDCGDIIFQSDISHLFRKNLQDFRAVYEEYRSIFSSLYLNTNFFSKKDKQNIKELISSKKIINAGLIIAPKEKMLLLCKNCKKMIKDFSRFGPDQIVVNYILQKYGFTELENKYNFVINVNNEDIVIKNGVFYFPTGEKISVVHNSGNLKLLRPIENFGYGKDRNQIKLKVYNTVQAILQVFDKIYKSQDRIEKIKDDVIETFASSFRSSK